MKRAIILVLDSLGLGSSADAHRYGDKGADTLGHIAEALGTSSFVFFGPTVEEFGFIPWRDSSRCFSSNLACRPCSKHGKSECRYKDYQCYSNIDFVTISAMVFVKSISSVEVPSD